MLFHEKQKFLKIIYENFYKAYNPKGADKLCIVYTPNEIVRFIIAGSDWLLHKHFGKTLADKNVEILDPQGQVLSSAISLRQSQSSISLISTRMKYMPMRFPFSPITSPT